MTLCNAICLGIIQGITEFLPVSSSAHLVVFSKMVDLPNQRHSFDIFLNIGTFFAILVFFKAQIYNLIGGTKDLILNDRTKNRELLLILLVSSLPTIVIFGIAEIFFDVDSSSFVLLSIATVLFAIILWVCDQKPTSKKRITMRDGLLVGIAQVASIIPGVSRLGACLSMMRYLNYSREESFRFSIILSIPPVMGACFLKSTKVFTGKIVIENWDFVLVGSVFSFLFGLLSLTLMSRFLKKHTITPIAIYRIIFGLFIAVYFYNGAS